ncbi:hypothetical protein C922_00932 [Plasmodium inui San Antonio 1]|uniref:Uncharacterized protein n=1 Tax=Plasmodium inui San Antonio 1 TaxID=1237626 RepID=W7AB85_9APIC|nr:hypothetical protein C922_00932 [Plasmodium inui San Antonio 1]EUD68533.1 hypothetical protein C922_00932 [Plasmodium inui San Antonio 1]
MRKRGKNAKKGSPKIASLGTANAATCVTPANAANPHGNIPGVNFSRIKSSYLEEALKLTNTESVKQKLKRKNDELRGMIRGEDIPVVPCLDSVLSVQSIPSDHGRGGEDTKELKHFEEFEIVLRGGVKDEEGVASREAEGQKYSCVVKDAAPSNEQPFVCDKVPSELDSEGGEKIEEGEAGEKIEEGEKDNVCHFLNKTKEAYKSLNLEKLFLVNSFNKSLPNEGVERKPNGVCENAHSRNQDKLSIVKTIERTLKGQNSFVMENIYNAFRGTINDFIDVYLQEEDEEMGGGRSKGTAMRKDTTIRSVDPFRHGEKVKLSDEHGLKKMYQMDNNIFFPGGEKDKIKVGQGGYATKREEDTNVKKYLSQFGDKRSFPQLGSRKSGGQSNLGGKTNSHDHSKCCKIKPSGANLFGESNVVTGAMAYLMGETSRLTNGRSSGKKSHVVHPDLKKQKQVEEAYSAYYPEAETFEYSSIISDYLYKRKGWPERRKDDGCTSSSEHNCANRDRMKYELHPSMGPQMSNVLNTQVNDRSVFDIAPMTHKYKYASNIILTINKIKNIERVVEINLNITDVQLKVPGMRIENVILPYKYASDLLSIKIKTFCEGKGGTSQKVMCREGGALDGHKPGEDKMGRQDKDEKNGTIKCYFVFIPLNQIKEGVVNKRLILISSKRKEEFEKEGLLPDTLYMIESQKLNCEREKHMYISVKICKNGVHFFPSVNLHRGEDNLENNYPSSENLSRNAFEPVYVCLYNDEVDREIGSILNGRGLTNKVRISKLVTKGHYLVNNFPFHFHFNSSNVLICSHGDITEEAEKLFHHLGKEFTPLEEFIPVERFTPLAEFIRVESLIDLFPTHIFPPVEDVLHLDLIKRNEFLQLKFVLHFLAITEIICIHLCSLFGFHVDLQPLFRDHLNAVKMDDGTGEGNRFTFLYTSYEEDAEPSGYFLNYTKPFVFRFQSEKNRWDNTRDNNCENAEEGKLPTHWDDNDLFIMDYARKQAIFLHNVIKHHGDIQSIPKCYDRKKRLFFTTDSRKKQFQIYYMSILRRYNLLLNRGNHGRESAKVAIQPAANGQNSQWGSQTEFIQNGNNSTDGGCYRGDKLHGVPQARDHSAVEISATLKRQGGANTNAPICTNGVENEKSRSHLGVTNWGEKVRGEYVHRGSGALRGKAPKVENTYRRNVTVTGQAKMAEERSFAGGNKTTEEEQKLSIREENNTHGDSATEKTSFYNLREYKNYHFHEKAAGEIFCKNGNSLEDLDRGRDSHEVINGNGWHVDGKGKESPTRELPRVHDDEIAYYNMHREDVPFSLENVKWDFNDDDVYPGEHHPVNAGYSNGYSSRGGDNLRKGIGYGGEVQQCGVSASSEATPRGGAGADSQTVSIAEVSYGSGYGYNEGCTEQHSESYADRLIPGRDARLPGAANQDWVASKVSASKVCIDHTDHMDHAAKHCKLVRRSDNEA